MAVHLQGPPLMKTAEVAAAYNVNPLTVTRWRQAGQLHPIKLPGAHYRYLRAEIEALINGTPLTAEQLEAAREQILRGIS